MNDIINQIMAFEDGQLEYDQVINLFQSLVDTGLAWQLQGRYGRMASALIKQGTIHERTQA